jgi:hypothetical protein
LAYSLRYPELQNDNSNGRPLDRAAGRFPMMRLLQRQASSQNTNEIPTADAVRRQERHGTSPVIAGNDVAAAETHSVEQRSYVAHPETRRTTVEQERRQQKRKRLRRQTALVAVILGTAFVARCYTATRPAHFPASATLPSASVNYDLGSMQGPNSVHFYAAAMDALPEVSARVDVERSTIAEMREGVAEAAESLSLLRQGFRYRYQGVHTTFYRGTVPRGLSAPVPNYVGIRSMARLLAVESHLKATQGDIAGALSSAVDAIRFGQDFSRESNSLIEGMLGTLCENIGGREAAKHIDGLSATEARTAIRRLEGLLLTSPDMGVMVEGERLLGFEALKGLSIVNPLTQTTPVITAADLLKISGTVFWYGKQEIVDEYARLMDEAVRRSRLPYQQAKSLGPLPESRIGLVATFVPNFQKAHLSRTSATAKQRVLLTRLAVQTYRQEHGGVLPPRLSMLTQRTAPYLSAIPADPFSMDGNTPLRYRNGVVYSVGENGADDSGTGDDADLFQ